MNVNLHLLVSLSPYLSLLVTTRFFVGFFVWLVFDVCFCVVNMFILGSTYKWYHVIFVFDWLTSPSMIISRSIHVAENGIISSFLWLNSVPLYTCVNLLYPFLLWWTFRLLPCLGYCKQHCNNQWGCMYLSNHVFLQIYALEWGCWIIW